MRLFGILVPALVAVNSACTSRPARHTDGPPPDLLASAGRFYDAYGRDLQAHSRARLAYYYHPSGALIVIGGQRQFLSRAALDARYQGAWEGPDYFAFDTLAFDSLSPDLVLVTGAFRWCSQAGTDTAQYIYAAILQAVDSGLAIRFEHETPRPSSAR